MKHGLLRYDPKDGVRKNMGDYIQSMAAKQFLNSPGVLVEREQLHEYDGEHIKLIMNAWWMHIPENWPPSEKINPLFISFHITPRVAERMLTENSVEYFKKHAPIGCRDKGTQKILERYGVETYFTGCLTLTLGNSYKHKPEQGKVLIVNPQFTRPTLKKPMNFIKSLVSCIGNYKVIKHISKKLYLSDSLLSMMKTTFFYNTYRKKFSDELLMDANYHSHGVNIKEFEGESERFDYTDKLLKEYSTASLVITSRLHAALPCVAIGIPTIFIYGEDIPRSSGRFDGLLEHVNCLQYVNKKWVGLNQFEVEGIINKNTNIVNRNTHHEMAQEMSNKVRAFLKS